MRIREFAGIHVESIPDLNDASKEKLKHKLEAAYDKIERNMFISCWYNSRYLSDIIFKMFAKGDNGVAIGTTVRDLMNCLEKIGRTKSHICNIISSNVQYVPHNFLHSGSLFEPAQVYAPVFLKGFNFT